MTGFPLGLIILLVIFILIASGLADKVLDRLHIKKVEAYAVVILMFISSYIELTFNNLRINIGGTVIPIIIAMLIWQRSNDLEVKTSIKAIVATALGFLLASIFIGVPFTSTKLINPLYYTPLIAGILAYVIGKTVKASFIGAIIGVLLGNMIYYLILKYSGRVVENSIGGSGFFDCIIFAGILAVLIAEVIGKIRGNIPYLLDLSSPAQINTSCNVHDSNFTGTIIMKGAEEMKDSKLKDEQLKEEVCPGGTCLEEEVCPGGTCLEESCPDGSCAENSCPDGNCLEEEIETCPGGTCIKE